MFSTLMIQQGLLQIISCFLIPLGLTNSILYWLNTSTLILIRIDPDWDRSRDPYEMIPGSFEGKFLKQQRAYYRV